jgi:flavin reductase (DIM6/NTAB) family NADH-FMN oxidoreductase RutF
LNEALGLFSLAKSFDCHTIDIGGTMKIEPQSLSRSDAYFLFTKLVVPRPIALLLTESPTGVVNVAPFSYFNMVSIEPAVAMVSIQRTANGMKDSSRNLLANQKAVIHIVDAAILDDMHATSKSLGPDESELTLTSFTTQPQPGHLPYIEQAKAHFNVTLYQHIEVGQNDLMLLKIEEVVLQERALKDGEIDLDFEHIVGRFGSKHYVVGGTVVEKERM